MHHPFIQLQTSTHHARSKSTFRLFNFLVLLGFFRVMSLAGKPIVIESTSLLVDMSRGREGSVGDQSALLLGDGRVNEAITWAGFFKARLS